MNLLYNKNMDISIVIPVFNVEKYLRRCVDSVLLAVKNFDGKAEILLIDNNSSDSSLEMARKFEGASVLQCHTAGAAAVRNYGMAHAHGKYVWFIDADDEITPDSISLLMGTARATDANLIMLGAKRIYADGYTDYLSAVRPDEPNFKSRFVRYGMGPWQCLIKRTWWNKNGFSFREGIIHEDMELMSALILYVDEKYAAVDKPLYLYYQNDESVLHKGKFSEHIFDIFPALSGLYERFEKAGAVEVYHDELEWFFIWNLLIDSAKDFTKFPEGHIGFARSREMLQKYFPGWRKNRFLKQKPLKLRARVLLNFYSFPRLRVS